ncbi:glutathione binding-like protein [Hyphomicrobium sp.]|uniref:glutathione binding-like protein n=1 Tax=Hyphomicrobium sp. TaxID=82 RepID=UPI002CD32D9F|nr:glutathione binding-like protein [Hyphomicrobium sp.]HVZ04832.1 glutathione binding-like protein [Hyphomicrobium sp.]
MTLYYSPGACSLADHIALHEAGAKFDLVKVNLKSHTLEDGRSFLEISPKGYVPALQFDDGEVLTENIAILTMIADRHPALMAPGHLGRYRLLEILAYISTEIHKSFQPLFAPTATEQDKNRAKETISKRLDFISSQLTGPYIFGEEMTVADAYLFVMLLWSDKNGIALPVNLKAFSEHVRARPTVQVALKHEGLI